MDNLTKFFSGIDEIRFTKGGNFIDRLQYKYTPMILGLSSVIMMALQFVGEFGISCWCPAQFTDSMVEYTNRRCWTQRTYHVPFNTPDIPREEKLKEHISFYQWVPAILFLQAFMFFIPSQIWLFVSGKSGIGVSKIVAKALKFDAEEDEDAKEAVLRDMVQRIFHFNAGQDLKGLKKIMRTVRDNSLPFLYIGAKVMYFCNDLLQMKFMNWLLGGTGMANYVWQVVQHVHGTGVWPESVRFPTVTLCDFSMRVHHNIHNHTVQCTLPLNFYHEKLFVSLWVWYAILAGFALLSLISWTFWVLTDVLRYMLTARKRRDTPYVRSISVGSNNESIKKFMWENFRGNGLFCKRMVQSNVGIFVTKQFIIKIREALIREKNKETTAKNNNFDEEKSAEDRNLISGGSSESSDLPPKHP